jgi:bacteriochlorophyll 4-vinyl reductase
MATLLLPPGSMPSTPVVNPRIPFSLLEAVRRIDTPEEEDPEAEYVHELRNKRLGLSETVYQQIRRYDEAVKRGQLLPSSEAANIGALISRRPDADELFRNAGRIVAAEIYSAIPDAKRRLMRTLPSFAARPLALGEIKGITAKYFGGAVSQSGASLNLTVPEVLVIEGDAAALGCQYYGTAFSELLRLLIDGNPAVDHVRCTQRGDSACEWRAEWGDHK